LIWLKRGNYLGKIIQLDDQLIDKIAAGEVVENPSSVVKELLENSIDAGADSISVKTREGGKSFIEVKDNGEGMNKDDAELCIRRHTTSKIKSEDDLFAISTLGFRGEALASICAVSKFTLITKTKDSLKATKLHIERNSIEREEAGSDKGTIITVEELFYNVPARKKFLKTIGIEFNNVIDVVTRYALAYPKISFTLENDGKTILRTTKTDKWANTIFAVYGNETAKNMIKLDYKDELIEINGLIGKPIIARKDKEKQTIFINGRYVKSREISQAVKDGYSSLLFLENEPVFVLNISLDEKKVDVNVHPRKEIVKISNILEIMLKIRIAVQECLKKNNLIVSTELKETQAMPKQQYSFKTDKQTTLGIDAESGDKVVQTSTVYDNSKNVIARKELALKKIGPFKVYGQLNKTYIIAENAQGLLIIDQHAAQERVNYEKMVKELKRDAIKKQRLVKGMITECSAQEFELIMQYKEMLEKTGFEIEEYGENNILVRAVPFVFERPSNTLIHELIDEIKEMSRRKIEDMAEERIIRWACRKSIKAGEEMTMRQVESLLNDLDKCELPFTCPHGRPTIISVSLSEIEKKFKRTG
jgi:DNA mismatch repair protein MutL